MITNKTKQKEMKGECQMIKVKKNQVIYTNSISEL